jgi:GTP-binding protein
VTELGSDELLERDSGPVPVLAVVGRPNVGKSTLVNRIPGRRDAVVEDVPGVTRDRVPYDAAWNGRRFTVVDTGGWEQDAKGLQGQVAAQAEMAIAAADAGGVVVEGRDITTVVAPGADVRVLLTASEEARLSRRALEVHGSDDAAAVAATRDTIVRRDAQDSTVAVFTEAADGVTVVDSSHLSLEETIDAVLALVPVDAP